MDFYGVQWHQGYKKWEGQGFDAGEWGNQEGLDEKEQISMKVS